MVGFKPTDVPPTAAVKFIGAGTAACIADLVTFPLDTAKVRLQVRIYEMLFFPAPKTVFFFFFSSEEHQMIFLSSNSRTSFYATMTFILIFENPLKSHTDISFLLFFFPSQLPMFFLTLVM